MTWFGLGQVLFKMLFVVTTALAVFNLWYFARRGRLTLRTYLLVAAAYAGTTIIGGALIGLGAGAAAWIASHA